MSHHRAQSSSAFTQTKALFERRYPKKGAGVYAKADWKRLQTAETLAAGDSVLDIGPGNGAFLHILSALKSFDRICGADIQRHSQLLLPENVEFRVQSITDLDFEDDAFDTVFCMEVLEHLGDDQLTAGLSQLRRIAKNRLVMTVPFNEAHPLWWHDKPGGHRQQFDAKRITEMFPTARAHFQSRPGVDWIFLVEGSNPFTSWPLVSDLLKKHLKKALKSSPTKQAVPFSSEHEKSVGSSVEKAKSSAEMTRNKDRIMDVYYGRHGSSESQDHARDRIHWILSQVNGSSVLDIGCSQGLLPILLGRSGFQVLGLDLMPEAIAQADAYLREEPDSVRKLVKFRVGDASQLAESEKYDCAVMGEVIEHHGSPARLLKSVRAAMLPGARLILTCPFAYHPDPDHKQTFFLSNFRELIEQHFKDVHLEVMHDFICCTCTVPPAQAATAPQSDLDLLKISEQAFLALQLGLRKQLKDLRYRLSQKNTADEKTAKDALAALCTQLDSRESQLTSLLREPNKTLIQDLSSSTKENERLKASVRAHKAALSYRTRKARPFLSHLVELLAKRHLSQALVTKKQVSNGSERSPESETKKWIRTIEHQPSDLPVACILDEFSWDNFRFECDLYQITKENWQAELSEKRPAFLFVESAWAGNGGNWQYKLTYTKPRSDNPLFALLAWCKVEGIPTVFWNKEDPPNYDHFLDAARRFDHIFTTDADCVARYEKEAPTSTVASLPFAAQPALQNPVNCNRIPKLGDICFAGAWYPRHPERFEDLGNLLQASREYDLHIYDRYLNHPQHEKYTFPDEYTPYIQGSLGFQEMTEKYRNYRIFLNVNSVKDSPTMFSRRVLEVLACGTAVVSGYARGIEELLGPGIVPLVTSADEAEEYISLLMGDELERDKLVLRAQRKIFSEHTYRHRFDTICQTLGLSVAQEAPMVSVITATIRKTFVDALLSNYSRQTFARKELIVVINENQELTESFITERAKELGIENYRTIVVAEGVPLGTCLNVGVAQASGDLFAKMDDDDFYGAEYLTDSVLALEYSGADCVGKESYYTYLEGSNQLYLRFPGRQHRECGFVIGTTLVGKRSLFPTISFGETRVGEDTIFLKRLKAAGKRLYSHSQYNYVKLYARNLQHHTWQIEEADYLKNTVAICSGDGRNVVCF